MIITRAPLRISFFGGGTDYPEYFKNHSGAVLASSLNKFCYLTASSFPSHLFDYNIRLSYREVELAKSISEIKHTVFRACLEHCGFSKDIELHTVADLPSFTGLGSSSAFTVALLQSLYSFKGKFLKPIDIAYEVIHIERKILKEFVGCQDQVMAAFGGFNRIEFRDEDDIFVQPLSISKNRLKELENHLVMVFTGVKRSAQKLAAKQIKKVSDNVNILSKMYKMVDTACDILCSNRSISEFGELLDEGWMLKKSLESSISNKEIEKMYEIGKESGALGGKLLGAGGGGFLLFFVPNEKKKKLISRFPKTQIIEPKLSNPGSQVIFSS